MAREEYFEAIQPYLSDEASAALAREMPVIEDAMQRKVKEFNEKLGEGLNRIVTELIEEQEKELGTLRGTFESALKTAVDEFNKNSKKGSDSSKAITDAADALNKSMDAYKDKWKAVGKTAQTVVLGALRGAGIPVPPLS